MQDQLQTTRTFLRMAWLYRWAGLSAAVLSCALGWTVVLLIPDQYEVSAKLYLDSRSMLRPLLRGIAFDSSTLEDTAALLGRTLLTRPNLEEVARRTDLDLGAHSPEDFDRLITGLAQSIKVSGTTRDNIYEISFRHPVPRTAKAVVDELLNRFMESALGDTRQETASTRKFLDTQIASYEQRLASAEESLKDFKQRNLGVMPGAQGGYFERLETARSQWHEAQLQLQEATRSRDQLHQQLGGSPAASTTPGSAEDPELAALDVRIADLHKRIDDLLLNFTDRHPDVIGMRKLLEDFGAKRSALVAAIAKRPPTAVASPVSAADPYRAQLQVEAIQAGAQVAALEARVAAHASRVSELEKKVGTVPEVEAELARLNRDYDVNKKQYDELLLRREQALMSQEAEQSQEDVKVKIIDPPRLPLLPVGPNRLLLASVVLVLGLGLGGGLCVGLSQLNPRVIDVPDVREMTGLPVLGAISLTAGPQHRQQRRYELLAFGAGLFGIVLVYAAQVTLFLLDINLHGRLQHVLGALT